MTHVQCTDGRGYVRVDTKMRGDISGRGFVRDPKFTMTSEFELLMYKISLKTYIIEISVFCK